MALRGIAATMNGRRPSSPKPNAFKGTMMSTWRNLGIHGALWLLVVSSFFHTVTRLKDSTIRFVHRPKVDDVSRLEMRLVPVRQTLSTNRYEVVGYLTDAPETADWFGEYFQTQYALAPVIIGGSDDSPVVVTILHKPSLSGQLLRDRHLTAIANYGDGVLLLKRSR
jgi:hypothetical protein